MKDIGLLLILLILINVFSWIRLVLFTSKQKAIILLVINLLMLLGFCFISVLAVKVTIIILTVVYIIYEFSPKKPKEIENIKKDTE